MKPKNKEVNIFNMSLLDILCGALGAFCFMMLVLFQYWKPEGPETKQVKVDTAAMEKKIEDLLKQMKGMSNLPPEVAERLKQMEQDFNRLHELVNQLKNQLQSAQAQKEAFQRQAQQSKAELDEARKELQKFKARNPITIVMTTNTAQHDVDLYVQDGKMEPPDPNKTQGRKWNGDVFFNSAKGPNSDVWLMRDAPPGEYKIYYKFLDRSGNPNPATVVGYYMHNNGVIQLPGANLQQDHQATQVGTIVIKPDYTSAFQPTPAFAESYKRQLESVRQNQPPPQKQ